MIHSNSFQQLVRCIPRDRLKSILETVSQPELQRGARSIAKHLSSLKVGEHPFKHPLFDDPRISYLGLEALRQQEISPSQFVTMQLYKAQKHTLKGKGLDLEFISLLDERTPEFIRKTCAIRGSSQTFKASNIKTLFDDNQLTTLLKVVQRGPISERGFFIYDDITEGPRLTATHALSKLSFNAFLHYLPEFRMLPTHSLVENFLTLKFSNQHIRPLPSIGHISEEEVIKMQWKGERVCHVPFEEFVENKADDHPAEGDEFYKHDIYHAYIASCAGPAARKGCMKMAEFIKKFLDKHHSLVFMPHSSLMELRHQLNDLEIPLFRPELRPQELLWDGKESSEEMFWHAWSSMFILVFSGEHTEMLVNHLYSSGFFHLFLNDVMQWKEGITKASLYKAFERLNRLTLYASSLRRSTLCELFDQEVAFSVRNIHPLQLLYRALKENPIVLLAEW